MLRFASSPTGDIHIGDLRIAILNYIVAQQRGEDLLVRIEDTNKEKNIEGKDQEILDLLALFGIEYSQVIYQSESVRFHSAMALQLIHEKKAFSCFCSPEWIERKHEESKAANKVYRYDDACRNLPAELVIDNTSPFTIRVARPNEDIVIEDKIQGSITFTPDTVDSFIIMHQDKTPTYNFSSAVDDMLSDISIVIRDEKDMGSTPKQEHIRVSLKYDKKVEYAHLPTILNDDVSVKFLLEEGFLPEAITNYLISTANKPPREIFKMQDAVEWFDLDKVPKESVEFDINRLKDINKKHLLELDAKELSRYVGFADEEIGKLARVYLEEVGTTKELRAKIEPIFAPKVISDEFKESAEKMRTAIKNAPYFEEYDGFKSYIMKESGVTGEEFLKTLHLLLTGAEDGPDITLVYKYLKNYIGEIIK